MPFVNIRIYKGQTLETKKKIARGITEVINKNTEIDPGKITVVYEEIMPENWAVGGKTGDERK